MKLPFGILLGFLKHLRILDLEQTPEGREVLNANKALMVTEPDWDRIRNSENYQSRRE